MSPIRRRLIVRGRVHGVGFRWSCWDQAQRLSVAGWVKNRPDGTVEVIVEGDEGPVAELVAWCRQGPPHARVTGVEVHSEPVRGEPEFRISR